MSVRKIKFTIEVSTSHKEQAFITGLLKHLKMVLGKKGTVYAVDAEVKDVTG